MSELTPSLEEWRNLYEAAIRVKEIAPWEWMEETDIFGVQDPETGDTGFVSTMGMSGAYLALAVYRGPEGLREFWSFHGLVESVPPESVFLVPHLQVSYQDRGNLTKKDRDVIKELGLRFRGRGAWPRFRCYRPGYLPWYLEAAEVRFLTPVLEQAREVALQCREDPALLERPDDVTYLVRVPLEEAGARRWENRLVEVPKVELQPVPIMIDLDLLEEAKGLPRSGQTFEVDSFMVRAPIQEGGGRPFLPFMVLVVDADTGLILGAEILEADPSLEEMWGMIPLTFVSRLAQIGSLPRRIRVRSPVVYEVLEPLVGELGFELERRSMLPNLNEAKVFLLERFESRKGRRLDWHG